MTLVASNQLCPDCGHNSLAEYDDHTYCFHPSCQKNTNLLEKGLNVPSRDFVTFNYRGIADNLVKEYRITGDRQHIYFPFIKQGRTVAYKAKRIRYNPAVPLQWRGITKEESDRFNIPRYKWVGKSKDLGFYGEWNCRDKGDLIIVEGYEDVLAARQMMSHMSVVSVPDGAESLTEACRQRPEFLAKFDNVYICMDSDEAGQEGFRKAKEAGVLPEYVTKLVTLPLKDANEMLMEKRVDDFRYAILRAEDITEDNLVSGDDLAKSFLDYLYTKETFSGTTTGYPQLDALIGGFRPGELMTIVGGTGVGKTTFAIQLAANAITEGMKCLFFSLETRQEQVVGKFLETLLQHPILGDEVYRDTHDKDYYEGYTKELSKYLTMTRHMGSLSSKELCGAIKAAKIRHNINLVVVDNITEATNTGEAAVKDIDKMMSDLNKLAGQLNITILVLAQMSRSKDDPNGTNPNLSRVRNSEGINQSSHMVMALTGKRDRTEREIVMLKNHRLYGKSGTAYFNYDINKKIFVEKVDAKTEKTWKPERGRDSEPYSPPKEDGFCGEIQQPSEPERKVSVPEQLRTESVGSTDDESPPTEEEIEALLATVQDRLHPILRSGHCHRIRERVAAIHRSKGMPGFCWEDETPSRQKYTSQLRLATVTDESFGIYKRTQKDFDELRGVGRSKPNSLGFGRPDT